MYKIVKQVMFPTYVDKSYEIGLYSNFDKAMHDLGVWREQWEKEGAEVGYTDNLKGTVELEVLTKDGCSIYYEIVKVKVK